MDTADDKLTPHRRRMLADKGRLLYGKFCGTGGRGICAESFAVFHIGRGESVVAEDLMEYLGAVITELQVEDPHNRLAATCGLLDRIRRHLAEAVGPEGTPNQALQQTGEALRLFVIDSSQSSTDC